MMKIEQIGLQKIEMIKSFEEFINENKYLIIKKAKSEDSPEPIVIKSITADNDEQAINKYDEITKSSRSHPTIALYHIGNENVDINKLEKEYETNNKLKYKLIK